VQEQRYKGKVLDRLLAAAKESADTKTQEEIGVRESLTRPLSVGKGRSRVDRVWHASERTTYRPL
jgi:hypothetical protein